MHVNVTARLSPSAIAFQDALAAFSQCYAVLLEPVARDAIYFDNEVIPACLQLVAIITSRAAGLDEDERISYLRLVTNYAPRLCAQIVADAERRNPPVLKGRDLPQSCLGVECGGG
jgi:hypothetical protein